MPHVNTWYFLNGDEKKDGVPQLEPITTTSNVEAILLFSVDKRTFSDDNGTYITFSVENVSDYF